MNRKLASLALALTVLLSACGGADSGPSPQSPETTPPETTAPATQTPETTPPETQSPETAPPETQTPETAPPETAGDLKELAMTFIGESVDDLIAAIGEPSGSDYAPSCLGSGEDGELFYDGFSVYTYREDGAETVQDVL